MPKKIKQAIRTKINYEELFNIKSVIKQEKEMTEEEQ